MCHHTRLRILFLEDAGSQRKVPPKDVTGWHKTSSLQLGGVEAGSWDRKGRMPGSVEYRREAMIPSFSRITTVCRTGPNTSACPVRGSSMWSSVCLGSVSLQRITPGSFPCSILVGFAPLPPPFMSLRVLTPCAPPSLASGPIRFLSLGFYFLVHSWFCWTEGLA